MQVQFYEIECVLPTPHSSCYKQAKLQGLEWMKDSFVLITVFFCNILNPQTTIKDFTVSYPYTTPCYRYFDFPKALDLKIIYLSVLTTYFDWKLVTFIIFNKHFRTTLFLMWIFLLGKCRDFLLGEPSVFQCSSYICCKHGKAPSGYLSEHSGHVFCRWSLKEILSHTFRTHTGHWYNGLDLLKQMEYKYWTMKNLSQSFYISYKLIYFIWPYDAAGYACTKPWKSCKPHHTHCTHNHKGWGNVLPPHGPEHSACHCG